VRITTAIDGETLRLTLAGEFDMGEVAYFRKAIQKPDDSWRRVVVEMSDVAFMDSSGLQELLHFQERVTEMGRELVLSQPSVAVLRLLELTGVDSHFTVSE
jgi:anti-sigma B factor antagonist